MDRRDKSARKLFRLRFSVARGSPQRSAFNRENSSFGDDERHDDWNRLPTELLHPDHLSPQPRRARPCIQHHSSGTGIWSVLSCSDYTTGIAPSCTLWMFAPPFRPPDLVRRAGGLHDDPLIGGSERSSLEA